MSKALRTEAAQLKAGVRLELQANHSAHGNALERIGSRQWSAKCTL